MTDIREPYYSDDSVTLWRGDSLEVLHTLADGSVDAIVTDPPYGLGFMGKAWDDLPPGLDFAREALRVLKPGGHLLAFGGTRTWHRLAVAVEDAGFEIRDSIAWLYGSGFPKSLDVSKAIDKRPAVLRHPEFAEALRAAMAAKGYTNTFDVAEKVVGRRTGAVANWQKYQFPEAKWWPALRDLLGMDEGAWGPVIAEAERARVGQYRSGLKTGDSGVGGGGTGGEITAHATPEAAQWQGWGTALKPAFEPIIVARKPLVGTVAANVLQHGTGALNIDACRIGTTDDTSRTCNGGGAGRWPANVVLDSEMAAALDEQSGTLTSGKVKAEGFSGEVASSPALGDKRATIDPATVYGDTGGASRFFYVTPREGGMIEPCEPANTAAQSSSLQRESAGSAPADAATSVSREGNSTDQSAAPSMSATGNGSRPSGESATHPTLTTASASSPESQQPRRTPTGNPANDAETLRLTDITTTTTSHSTSAGYADPATSSTTSPSREVGVAALPLDDLDARFKYCAKADVGERPIHNGVAHPTVKPLALMRWLVRLVTPTGGTVLEPFAGSGATVEACILERFRCIAIEREATYLPLITQRIHRRLDPVAYLTGTDDLGLFGDSA